MCKAALTAAFNTGKSKKSVAHGSYSVKTPFGNNICVAVTLNQCYPAGIRATTVAPGKVLGRGGPDEEQH